MMGDINTIERERILGREEIQQRVRELGKWFHNMNLRGVWTAPDHFLGDYPYIKFRNFAHALPQNLQGKSVLDIGCNAGFYSTASEARFTMRPNKLQSGSTSKSQ